METREEREKRNIEILRGQAEAKRASEVKYPVGYWEIKNVQNAWEKYNHARTHFMEGVDGGMNYPDKPAITIAEIKTKYPVAAREIEATEAEAYRIMMGGN